MTEEAVSPGAATPTSERNAFHAELRERTLPVFGWALLIFNPAFLLWGGFDYLLAREHFTSFFTARIVASAFNTVLGLLILRTSLRRLVWEGFFTWLVVFAATIAWMLPQVDTTLLHYTMGFTIVVYGSSLLPFWAPRWALASMLAMVGAAVVAFALQPTEVSSRDLVAAGFFLATAVGLSLVMASFKYELARRDFTARRALAEVARRESSAREDLAKTTDELAGALDQLKAHDRRKNEFFANISHELRTPLTLILAPLEDLANREELGPHAEQLDGIRRNAHRLLRLIDDLLELSRVDAGGLRLVLDEVDVRALAATVVASGQAAAESRGIRMGLTEAGAVESIYGDAHRLEIILTNLVSNAIKYTGDGGEIEVIVTPREDGVAIGVRDTGSGIPAAELESVFERFYQVNRNDRRRVGGVGIGLALARELAELHGGTLDVASELDKGTTFTLTLRYGREHIRNEVIERRRQLRVPGARLDALANVVRAPRDRELVPSTRGPKAGRVLLAEDQPELRAFIRQILEVEFEVITAVDGDEAWVLTREHRPDIVVSDVMMPGRSGTELCHDIKSDPALANTPVILLTAQAGEQAMLFGFARGADDFVAKPFHPQVLVARVHAQLRLRNLSLALASQEKLAGVGTLAAGVAHEVRNPVNAILNAAHVLLERAKEPLSQKMLRVIADAGGRIRDISSTLDAQVRPAEGGGVVPFDLREGIESTLLLLEYRLGGCEFACRYGSSRRVVAPAGPINQVFVNLIDNAIRAGAKRIELWTEDEGDRVTIRVRDDGPGVPQEIAERIFDPFFTTRPPGEGTGLGLYLAKKIVTDAGGILSLRRPEGGGAEFCMELPAEHGGGARAAS